jgi:hypothetical protein
MNPPQVIHRLVWLLNLRTQEVTDEMYKKFADLANSLTPENLARDGEATQEETETEYYKLKKEWETLEKQVGRKVSEDEIWQRYYDELIAKLPVN